MTLTLIAKTIPLDTAASKPATGSNKPASTGQGQEGVNLGEGAQTKKAGCC